MRGVRLASQRPPNNRSPRTIARRQPDGIFQSRIMEITFTKTAERKYAVLVRRDDGVVLEVPSFDRPAGLPHDIAHFVVESELSLERGFWGLLAAGVVLPNVSIAAGRLRPHAAERSRALLKEAGQHPTEAEVLVSVMLRVAGEGVDGNWTEVHSRLDGAWRPRRSQRGPISHDEVRRACRRLREVERQWEALPVGESMSLRWPARHRQGTNRTRHKRAS